MLIKKAEGRFLQKKTKGQRLLHDVRICTCGPVISHLLFTDDCFLFFTGFVNITNVFKNILSSYETASRQAINFQKSEIFCRRSTPTVMRTAIANILEVRQVLGTRKYLGIPYMMGRMKNATFKFIKGV